MKIDFRAGWDFVRRHPYADSAVLLVVLFFGVGSVRWLSRPTVLLKADGINRTLHPTAKTVGDALAEAMITLGPDDLCTPALESPLGRNTIVQITRVVHKTEYIFERKPPQIKDRTPLKANLRPVVVEKGYVEESTQTVRATYYDGVKTSQVVLKRKTVRRPLFRLTLLNRKNQQPVKTYDLIKAKKMLMRATGYYVGEKYVPSDTTFLGYKLRRGLVAVDPKVIPLRTRLYVKGYGYAYAADTGSAIKGNRIDLAVKDKHEEAKFNRQQMTVYILEEAKTW